MKMRHLQQEEAFFRRARKHRVAPRKEKKRPIRYKKNPATGFLEHRRGSHQLGGRDYGITKTKSGKFRGQLHGEHLGHFDSLDDARRAVKRAEGIERLRMGLS